MVNAEFHQGMFVKKFELNEKTEVGTNRICCHPHGNKLTRALPLFLYASSSSTFPVTVFLLIALSYFAQFVYNDQSFALLSLFI